MALPFKALLTAAERTVKSLKEPHGIPGEGLRGTAEAPRLLTEAQARPSIVTERAPDSPFYGAPETREQVRATERVIEPNPIGELKTILKGFLEPFPQVQSSVFRSNDISEKLYQGAWRNEAASTIADRDVANLFNPLTRDPVNQAQLVHDYYITMDEVAQAKSDGRDTIRKIPLSVWEASADALHAKVKEDAEVSAVVTNIRKHLDDMWDDMSERGWVDPKRKREDYTPIRRFNAMVDGLATFTGENPQALKSRLLSAQQQRVGGSATRETDLIDLLRRHRTEYLSKRAMHDAFLDIIADPTINVTDKLSGKDFLPEGFSVYRPGPGMIGSTAKTAEGHLLDAYLKGIDPKGKITAGGYVLPTPLVRTLEEFNRRQLQGTEGLVARTIGQIPKWMTVYNPANTQVNRGSDLLVAMFLPETGKAQPLGVLKWYGDATKAAYGLAFKGGRYIVELHGQKVDITDLAIREGLTTGTIQHEVGGKRMPAELLKYTPDASKLQQEWFGGVLRTMEADRLATELTPRIAAGLEAVERTGDWSQFGKVGRDITFRYGAGAPKISQLPIVRIMAPFIQFQGLATQRMLHTIGAKGMEPKVRLALALAAVPMSIHSWNTQNDAYKEAELSLPEYERNQMHIWVPDFENPAIPKRSITGSPVALRFRMWVPDQVAGFVGLGNAVPRAGRVLSGRDTPMQFVKQSMKSSADNIASMLVLPSMVQQALGKNAQGEVFSTTPQERVERFIPLARLAGETYRGGKEYGLKEATFKFLQGITGMRTATTKNVGYTLLDAQLTEAKRDAANASREVQMYRVSGPPDKLEAALNRMIKAKEEVRRVAEQMKKEKAAGYAPPAADRSYTPATKKTVERAREFSARLRVEREEKP